MIKRPTVTCLANWKKRRKKRRKQECICPNGENLTLNHSYVSQYTQLVWGNAVHEETSGLLMRNAAKKQINMQRSVLINLHYRLEL